MPDGGSSGLSGRAVVGRAGEDAAAALYRSRGFEIVARNWRCALGELDVVARRGGLVVFCEVKTRSGASLGGGYEAVGWRKQRKLRQLGEVFLQGSGLRPAAVRFDVASVRVGARARGGPGGPAPSVELFEDAF